VILAIQVSDILLIVETLV